LNTNYHSRAIFNGSSSSYVLNRGTPVTGNPGAPGIINGILLGGTAGQASRAGFCEVYVIPNPTGTDITNSDAYILAKWGV
jgi:hypothetical protein